MITSTQDTKKMDFPGASRYGRYRRKNSYITEDSKYSFLKNICGLFTKREVGYWPSSFLTRECESNERVIAFGGHISLARWAVNFNRAINLCTLIYSFTS